MFLRIAAGISRVRLPLILSIVFCLTTETTGASTFNITGSAADYELNEALTVGSTSGSTIRCGATSATTPGGRNGIFIFALPAIDPLNRVSAATLNFTYASKSGSPSFNADLWGVGFYSSTAGMTNIFLKADSDTNAANMKLQDNVIVPASTTGSITSSNFAAYLNGFYATNGGYSGGAYVFLRANPDANPGNAIVGYNLNSSDSSSKPVLTILTTNSVPPISFVHPGLLHAQADLDRMKQMVGQGIEPWASAFTKFTNDSKSQLSYSIAWQPTTNFYVIGRGNNAGDNVNKSAVEADCSAAYQLALMWCITSNSAYAQKAIQILNGWSSSLTNIIGTDAILAAGLDGAKFLNAAELLRYSNSGWAGAEIAQFLAMMTNVFYPVISNFATFANGNWDISCEKTMLDMGVFCDRTDLFARATNYFYTGIGAGALTNYIFSNGQLQESGRDQTHAQLGIGQLAELCEVAWHQGVDLYGAASNRVLAGFEYTAKYNLGYSVPYTPANFTGWSNGIWFSTTIATNNRGELRPIYEMAYNHYVNRRGFSAPFTTQIAASILSPEGPWSAADHPGYGTLTCTIQQRAARTNKVSVATMGASSGVWFGSSVEGDTSVAGINAGDFSSYNNVNFNGVKSFSTRVASSSFAGSIEVRLDSPAGTLLGTCAVPVTDGSQFWVTTSCNLAPASGTHTLYLVYQSSTNAIVFNHTWFALDKTNVFPQTGSNIVGLATNSLTAVDVGGQPLGMNWFGGESVTNNAPANGFPVGTNFIVWVSTNLSGNYVMRTQTVVLVAAADTPSALIAEANDGQVALNWNAATNAETYNVKQSVSNAGPFTNVATAINGTNFLATNLINGALYWFLVTSTNDFTESNPSPPADARPTSSVPPTLLAQGGNGTLLLNWPLDRTGWHLQAQTNTTISGLGTNWIIVPGSSATNSVELSLAGADGCVFFRLIHP